MAQRLDFDINSVDSGKLLLFTPLSRAAEVWFEENVDPDENIFHGPALVCETAFAPSLMDGMARAGLLAA